MECHMIAVVESGTSVCGGFETTAAVASAKEF